MAGGAIRAGEAFVELATRNNPLMRGLKAAEARLKQFGQVITNIGSKLTMLGGAVFAPLLAAAVAAGESGSALLIMSQRTGASVEALSGLQYAARQAGVDAEALEKGMVKMARTIQQAADGSHEAQQALAHLGITVAELSGLSPDQQFARIARGLAEIPNPTTRAARAMAIFGRGAAELLPLLNRGEEGIRAFVAEAQRLGLVKTTQQAEDARAFKLAYDQANLSIRAVITSMGAALMPLLVDALHALMPIVQTVKSWVKEHKPLITVIFAVAAGIVGIGVALVTVGSVFRMLSVAVSVVGSVFGLVFGVAGTLIGGLFSTVMALLSPFGLVVVAAVAAGAALALMIHSVGGVGAAFELVWSLIKGMFDFVWSAIKAVGGALSSVLGGVGSALGSLFGSLGTSISSAMGAAFNSVSMLGKTTLAQLGQGFTDVKDVAVTAWGGISAAISAGDWGLAAEIAVKGIVTAFKVGMLNLKIAWRGVRDWFVDLWSAAVDEAAKTIENMRRMMTPEGRAEVERERQEKARDDQFIRETQARLQQWSEQHGGQEANRENLLRSGEDDDLERDRQRMEGIERMRRTPQGVAGVTADEERERNTQREQGNAGDRAKIERLKKEMEDTARRGHDAEDQAAGRRWAENFLKERFGGQGAGGLVDEAQAKVDVAGSFSAKAVAGLGGQSVTDLLGQIRDNTRPDRQPVPVFG